MLISSESYLATTYTFAMTPMFKKGASLAKAVDRKLCFSYKTLEFLSKNGWRMEVAFPSGITYLSRYECTVLLDRFLAPDQEVSRGDREPLDIATLSGEAQAFYRDARDRIEAMLQNPDPVWIQLS